MEVVGTTDLNNESTITFFEHWDFSGDIRLSDDKQRELYHREQ